MPLSKVLNFLCFTSFKNTAFQKGPCAKHVDAASAADVLDAQDARLKKAKRRKKKTRKRNPKSKQKLNSLFLNL
jgi:hypothetical protein